jgi:hypothetical protein
MEKLNVYAEHGGGSSGGAPSSGGGWGHSWGDIIDNSGNREGSGFYPDSSTPAGWESIFGGTYGKEFADDTQNNTSYDSSYSFDINSEQYDAIKKYINNFQENGDDWSMGEILEESNNCTDYIEGMLDVAGIEHPDFTTFGKTDPDKLGDWLNKLKQDDKKN